MDLKLDIERINAELSDDFVLLYKLHPQTAKRFSLSAEERENMRISCSISQKMCESTSQCALLIC